MAFCKPRVRWKATVGFGGGHHPYYGSVRVEPFGLVTSGGARTEIRVAVVDTDRGEVRYECKHLLLGVSGDVVVSKGKYFTATNSITAYDARTGTRRELELPDGEAAFALDERSLFGGRRGGPLHERAFDPVHGIGDVVRVFEGAEASDWTTASASLVTTGTQVYDCANGVQLGRGRNIILADPDWFSRETDRVGDRYADRLELHTRAGLRWSLVNATLLGFDHRIVVVQICPEAKQAYLALIDRTTGAVMHATEPRSGESWQGWGTAIVVDDHVIANDKQNERKRSMMRALAFDGSERWRFALELNGWVSDFAATANRLYALMPNGDLYGIER